MNLIEHIVLSSESNYIFCSKENSIDYFVINIYNHKEGTHEIQYNNNIELLIYIYIYIYIYAIFKHLSSFSR